MAKTFQQYMQDILNAMYGSEVRDAIYQTISMCYSDVNNVTLREDAFATAITNAVLTGEVGDSVMACLNILTEATSNKFNLLTSVVGRLNTSTGEVDTATTGFTTDWIAVSEGDLVYFDSCSEKVFYNTSKVKQAAISQSGATAYTVPSGGGYIRASCTNANRGVAKINVGTRVSYVPGRSAVDHNLRSITYSKTEIDTMIGNIDISLTTEQKAALIALLD